MGGDCDKNSLLCKVPLLLGKGFIAVVLFRLVMYYTNISQAFDYVQIESQSLQVDLTIERD